MCTQNICFPPKTTFKSSISVRFVKQPLVNIREEPLGGGTDQVFDWNPAKAASIAVKG